MKPPSETVRELGEAIELAHEMAADGFLKYLEGKAGVPAPIKPYVRWKPVWASRGQAQEATQQPSGNTLPPERDGGSTP